MAQESQAVPAAWEPRLAVDLAELVEAAAALDRLVGFGEVPADFALALGELASPKARA